MAYDLLENLVLPEITPLTQRQIAQTNRANPHPFESDHAQSDQFAHTANLALASFIQHET